MRRRLHAHPLAATAVLAALAPGCGGGEPERSATAKRCVAENLRASLQGVPSRPASGTQLTLRIVYRNAGSEPCVLRGEPVVRLIGPADPNGTSYTIPPSPTRRAPVRVAAGDTAAAELVVLTQGEGDVGSLGSRDWVPRRLRTTPPGGSGVLATDWPERLAVMRQDSATHPGSYVRSVAPGA